MQAVKGVIVLILAGLAYSQQSAVQSSNVDPFQRLLEYQSSLGLLSGEKGYIAVAVPGPISQLDISDIEAKNICQEYAVSYAQRNVPHPNSCSAHILCLRSKQNAFEMDTLYRITATMFAEGEGSFFNPKSDTQMHWDIHNNCSADPCKRNKFMTDGRSCYSYVRCVRDSDNQPIGYDTGYCAHNESFNVASGQCEHDDTCNILQPYRERNLYCNATPEVTPIPGLTGASYYTRTYTTSKDNYQERFIQQLWCPGGTVFDSNNPGLCRCILANLVDQCPKTLVDVSSEGSKTWNNASKYDQDGFYTVEESLPYRGWVKFTGNDNSFFTGLGFANTQLAYDFDLRLEFKLRDQGNQGQSVALMSNSLNSEVCPEATLRVFLNRGTQNPSVVAEVTKFDNEKVTVQSDSLFTQNTIKVGLKRVGSQLILTVNDGAQDKVKSVQYGSGRLKKSNCGLFVAKSNRLVNFDGWMKEVLLINNCTVPAIPEE